MDVKENPIKQVIIHRMQSYDLESFISMEVTGNGQLGYCDGFVYSIAMFPMNDQIVREEIESGIKRVLNLNYAELGDYQTHLTNKNNISTNCTDLSNNDMISSIFDYVRRKDGS